MKVGPSAAAPNFVRVDLKHETIATFTNRTDLSDAIRPCADGDATNMRDLPPEIWMIIKRVRGLTTHRIIRLPQVSAKLGQGNSTTWKQVADHLLPSPLRIGIRSVGWVEAEIDAVISMRIFSARTNLSINIRHFVSLLVEVSRLESEGVTPLLTSKGEVKND